MCNDNAMKIVHITFSTSGGAGKVAVNLQRYQKNIGIQSEIYYLTDRSIRWLFFRRPFLFLTSLFDFFLVRRYFSKSLFTLFRRGFNFRRVKILERNVVLHIHWFPGLISYGQLSALCDHAVPILVTLHDMLPVTGGCHFSYGCQNFLSKCEKCPQARGLFSSLISKRYQKKTELYKSNSALAFSTPGPWLLDLIKSSPILEGKRTTLIFNPVDLGVFFPRENSRTRSKLGIPENAFVVGCCAVDIRDPRKRLELVLRGWELIQSCHKPRREIWLVIVGGGQMFREYRLHPKVVKVPFSSSPNELAEIYSVFDVHCSMSTAETFPNVVHECAAMGIPAILSSIPGHMHAINNFAIGVNTLDDIKNTLLALESDSELITTLSNNALKFAASLDESVINEMFMNEYCRLNDSSAKVKNYIA